MSAFDARKFVDDYFSANPRGKVSYPAVATAARADGLRRAAEIARATEGPAVWAHHYGYQVARDDIAAAIEAEIKDAPK